MLLEISRGSLDSPFILFIDDADHKGNVLFREVLKSFIKSSTRQVHAFCWEASTVKLLSNDGSTQSFIKLHDCFSDCKGWINPKNQVKSLQDMLNWTVAHEDKDTCIIIDSLSNMFHTLGFGQCVKSLQCILSEQSKRNGRDLQIMCMVHGDVLPKGEQTLSLLKHMSSTIVKVKNNEAHITHCKPGGAVEEKNEKFFVSAQGDLIVEEAGKSDKTLKEEKSAILPQDVASFRVSLNEKEREDRNKLILPYMRTPDSGGGRVFYQPDAVDDWDDEDPDDDLDI